MTICNIRGSTECNEAAYKKKKGSKGTSMNRLPQSSDLLWGQDPPFGKMKWRLYCMSQCSLNCNYNRNLDKCSGFSVPLNHSCSHQYKLPTLPLCKDTTLCV